ncbi:ribosome rescue GTPase HflX [Algiphilus aromaticivorans]|jgi:GTP-binding protein HflX|uniref:ribosome rescue GTPase HflX n=1 Tax=Algiphilus aromaticivorans TaxID=382454 RepID=UPI0005C19719|nr:ribosome rescue GTPase HflX [Algiphilus aromaticivorans]
MIEHEATAVGQTAILVHVSFPGTDTEADTAEFVELARSAGAEVRQCVGGRRQKPDPRHFVGRGKAEEIAELVAAEDADLVVFNHDLSPSQERNLERLLCCRVLDRAGLILDIFASRARTHEGKLQVELAQLQHLATRLVRGWSHLERQKGGIGLRGPGESQLETDRRLIRDRMRMLEKRLDTVRNRRARSRASRQRNETPTVSLVGYTNAGKSTLFNALTTGDTFASKQLFATLDPTLRRFTLDPGNHVVLADTVGFIRDLPPDLVAAFRATLEETREAELLLHVVDWSDPEREQRIEQVEAVLHEIGADEVPRIMVCNKTDLLPQEDRELDTAGEGRRVAVSAVSGDGLDRLREAVRAFFHGGMEEIDIYLPPEEARLRARLYDAHAVRSETADANGTMRLRLHMPREQLQRMCAAAGIPWDAATADPARQADC